MRLYACRGVISFEGRVRHGLLMESSAIAPGLLWLSITNGNRFIHDHRIIKGARCRSWSHVGAGSMPKDAATEAVKMPKAKLGAMMVLMSLKVKSQIAVIWEGMVLSAENAGVNCASSQVESLENVAVVLLVLVLVSSDFCV